MMLAAEPLLLTPLLVNLLVVGVMLVLVALVLFIISNRDATRRREPPTVEEDPDPVHVAYLRQQSAGLVELVMFDLVAQGRLEVIEEDEDEEFWAMQQVADSDLPESEGLWPVLEVPAEQHDAGEADLEDDDPGDEDLEQYEKEADEEEADEEEADEEEDDEEEEEDRQLMMQEAMEASLRNQTGPHPLFYMYFDTPKFPRQSLGQRGGIRSMLTQHAIPIQRKMVQRELVRPLVTSQGCTAGCLMLMGVIITVAFVIGTFVHFSRMAFNDGEYLPLLFFTLSLVVLRLMMVFGRRRLGMLFRFLRPRTSWGEQYLEELESRFYALLPGRAEAGGNGHGNETSPLMFASAEQRASLERLAVALFGSWVLVGGPYEDLAFYLGTADPEEPASPAE